MIVRSYKGQSLDRLHETIRGELGPEAVIVSSRTCRPRDSVLAPLFGHKQYELVAVVDDGSAESRSLRQEEFRNFSAAQLEKWQQMQAAMQQLLGEMQALSRGPAAAAAPAARQPPPAPAPRASVGWDPRFVKKLATETPAALKDSSGRALREGVARLLCVEENFPIQAQNGPHVVVLVGPTGSGKTTTLAKLAARWCLDRKLKVGLITTDTFRVAAVDQIKEYATLLGLELAVAFSAAEAAKAVARFSDKDVILVDTPGRNHYDQIGLAGIRGVLQGMGKTTVLLVVPATLDRQHAAELIGNFSVLRPNYLVITKIDETRQYGVLTGIACDTDCPIAFLTDGQRVPQDVKPAKVSDLVGLLVRPARPFAPERPRPVRAAATAAAAVACAR
ncbi:MAG: hypothetical protein JXR37_14085 [Kiritimatiellae bacterium]|nr:hypothetical protein [Kiritimatiellia bacterium]